MSFPRLLQLIFALAFIEVTTAAVSCYFSYYNSVEFQCTLSSYNQLSEHEPLEQYDYEDYRPYLTSLYKSGSQISYIPIGFFQTFYKVKRVFIENAGLKEITQNSFRKGAQITSISLRNNLLNSLPADAFIDCLYLSQLYLDNNQLSSFDIQPGLPKLQEVTLRYNRITALNKNIFAILPDLTRLDLTGNNCASRDFRTSNGMSLDTITKLELTTCSFNWRNLVAATTTPRTPASSPTLRECKYSIHPVYGYTCVFNRVTFKDDYNDFFQISGTHLPGKTDADVTGVYFTRSSLLIVPTMVFRKFRNLAYLDISFSGIVTADTNTIDYCGNLRFLNAEYNDIQKITESFLSSCRYLENVNLDYNLITSISSGNSFLKRSAFLNKVSLIGNNCVDQEFADPNLCANFQTIFDRPLRSCLINYVLGSDAPVAIRRNVIIPEEAETLAIE